MRRPAENLRLASSPEPAPALICYRRNAICPAWSSAASAAARCEPVPAFPLIPNPSTCPAWSSAASVAARCEPVPAFPLIPDPSTYPAWSLRHPSLPGVSRFPRSCCYLHAPSPERPSVEHPPARGAVCGTSDGAWDIRRHVEHCRSVEHRGAHQGRFHSPHRFSEARVRRKGAGAHGVTSS